MNISLAIKTDLPLSNNGLTLTDELVRYQLGNKFKNNSSAVGFVLRQINFSFSDFWKIFEFIDWFESRNMSQRSVEDEMSFIRIFLTHILLFRESRDQQCNLFKISRFKKMVPLSVPSQAKLGSEN